MLENMGLLQVHWLLDVQGMNTTTNGHFDLVLAVCRMGNAIMNMNETDS